MVLNAVTVVSPDTDRFAMEDISFEDIEMFDDVFTIIQRGAEYGINLDGCCSLEDMKERFVMHKRKIAEQNQENKTSWSDGIKKDIDKKREALIPIMVSAKEGLLPGYHCIRDILSEKGTCSDLCKDIDDAITALSSQESCIVIAGATGAGKSTFLNLLLGMSILPEHVLSCTATVCKLKYDTQFRARIILKNGGSRTFLYKDLEDAKSRLENEIFIKDLKKREEIGMAVAKEIEIYIPADILKFGITIVDTPGIDENDAMDDLVRNFIMTNHIAAFMYIVKSDVQQEGLLNFLESLLTKKPSESTLMKGFNPKAAMFICNKWDLIPDEDKQRVKEHVFQKLEAVWTGLDKSQVKYFSTKNARFHQDVDKDYKTTEYRNLLRDIEQLFVTAIKNNVDVYYNWLKTILEECSLYTRTIIANLKTTQEEQEKSFQAAVEKMGALKSHAREILADLRGQIASETKEMIKRLKQFLQMPDTKREMQVWTDDEIPFSDFSRIKDVNPLTIFERRDLAILRRLFRVIDSWEESKKFKSHIDAKMDRQIKEKLFLLDDEMKKISNELKDSDSIKSSLSSTHSVNSVEEDSVIEDITSKTAYKSAAGRLGEFARNVENSASGAISKALVAGALQPMLDKVIKAKFFFQLRRTSSVMSDAYMNDRAGKILKAVTASDDVLTKIVERFTYKETEQLNSIEKNIPKFVQATDRLIEQIRLLREQNQENQSIVRKMALCIKSQMDQMKSFDGLGSDEIDPGSISLGFDEIHLGTSSRASEFSMQRRDAWLFLWSLLQKGSLITGTQQKLVMVKLYFTPLPENELHREISRLRRLHHPSISTFRGMTRVERHIALVFEDHLTSARRFLKRSLVSRRDAVMNVLNEVAEGLIEIHKQGLVHMELTQDTVMVNQLGEVKLCGACLPRRAKFPTDQQDVEAGEFTCLSPEVLHGQQYTADSDIYSLGLLIWELILEKKPYQAQWRMSLGDFIEAVNPADMLTIPNTSALLQELLQGCVLAGPESRTKLVDVKERLSQLNDDPVVNSISSALKRSKVLKRQSRVTSIQGTERTESVSQLFTRSQII